MEPLTPKRYLYCQVNVFTSSRAACSSNRLGPLPLCLYILSGQPVHGRPVHSTGWDLYLCVFIYFQVNLFKGGLFIQQAGTSTSVSLYTFRSTCSRGACSSDRLGPLPLCLYILSGQPVHGRPVHPTGWDLYLCVFIYFQVNLFTGGLFIQQAGTSTSVSLYTFRSTCSRAACSSNRLGPLPLCLYILSGQPVHGRPVHPTGWDLYLCVFIYFQVNLFTGGLFIQQVGTSTSVSLYTFRSTCSRAACSFNRLGPLPLCLYILSGQPVHGRPVHPTGWDLYLCVFIYFQVNLFTGGLFIQQAGTSTSVSLYTFRSTCSRAACSSDRLGPLPLCLYILSGQPVYGRPVHPTGWDLYLCVFIYFQVNLFTGGLFIQQVGTSTSVSLYTFR